jgi:hypothetical protein
MAELPINAIVRIATQTTSASDRKVRGGFRINPMRKQRDIGPKSARRISDKSDAQTKRYRTEGARRFSDKSEANKEIERCGECTPL